MAKKLKKTIKTYKNYLDAKKGDSVRFYNSSGTIQGSYVLYGLVGSDSLKEYVEGKRCEVISLVDSNEDSEEVTWEYVKDNIEELPNLKVLLDGEEDTIKYATKEFFKLASLRHNTKWDSDTAKDLTTFVEPREDLIEIVPCWITVPKDKPCERLSAKDSMGRI